MSRQPSQFIGFCAILGLVFSGLGFSLIGPSLPVPVPKAAGRPHPERAVSVPPRLADDPALGMAVRTLLASLGAGWKLASSPGTASILVGETSELPAELFEAAPGLRPPDEPEAYAIGRTFWQGRPVLVVAGRDRAGVVYATLRLADLARVDPEFDRRPVVRRVSPAFGLRLVGPPLGEQPVDPGQALRWGFNAVVVPPWTGAVDYAVLDPRLAGSDLYWAEAAWRAEQARRLKEAVRAARAYGLKVFSPGDFPSLPESVAKFYGSGVGENGRLCFDRPKTQELLRFALTYVLMEFDLDGIIVRTGENYSGPPLVGQSLYTAWCGPGQPVVDSLRTLLKLEAGVVRATGKVVIQRAWDLGADGFHASPAVVRAVTAGLPPEPGLILSFKHTATDFWQYTGWNPNLLDAPDGFPRLVEVEGAREYEGKGVFPSYVAPLLVVSGAGPGNPLVRARQTGAVGLWLWNVGGGWGGPVPRSDLWVDLNAYAVGRLAWEPEASPVGLAQAWAARLFPPAAAAEVGGFALASPELLRLMLYTRAYADRAGPWAPNNLWVRDDEIRGGHNLAPIYRIVRDSGAFAEAVAEKEEARLRMREWVRRLEGALAGDDSPQARAVLASAYYQQSLFELLADYFTGIFYFYRWAETRPAGAGYRALARQRLEAVAGRLEAHRAAAAAAGTPFRDAGMQAAVRDALAALGDSAP
jgi:hypothetical protein